MSRFEFDERTPRGRSREDQAPNIAPGTQIDHFRVIRSLGRGGMGQVYLARDTKLGRKVALKMLQSRQTGKRPFLLRFLMEARTTARFNHPHIVTIHAVGDYASQPYLALEYLSGETLTSRLHNRSLGAPEILRIGTAIASALAEAHRHGILHLDLKPSNVVITRSGHPKVLDFGLSQNVEAEPTSDDLIADQPPSVSANSQTVVGTPTYMAPEQWRRKPRSEATDVWALGVILHEMLVGQRPFARHEGSLEILEAAVTSYAEPPRPDATSPELADLVARCLLPSPKARPTAETVEAELSALLQPRALSRLTTQDPFRGLLAFTSRQADVFFGRDREIAEAVERLVQEPILAIVGASGAGKSSLVQAGLIPRITEQGPMDVLLMRPGHDPFRTLATRILSRGYSRDSSKSTIPDPEQVRTLAADLREVPQRLGGRLEATAQAENRRTLLVVDQLEELYTLASPEDATQFMRSIALAADDAEDPVRVVFTVRDDYLSRIATSGPEVRSVLRRMMLVQVPEHTSLKDILTKPIEMRGYRYEDPDMVKAMIEAVNGRPSSLPLLQFAAIMLWQLRDEEQHLLTREAYDQLGGVEGALARHADGVLNTLDDQANELARQILSRLVTSEETRRVVSRDALLENLPPEAEAVLHRLVESRLVSLTRLSTDELTGATLELAHESLIHTWQRLRTWLDDSREERRFLAEIEQSATLWERRGSRPEEVWTGTALTEAVLNRQRCIGAVPQRVDRFLNAGMAAEKRRRWRRQILIAAAVLGLVIISFILYLGKQDAVRQQRIAELGKANAEREGAAAGLLQGHLFEARAKLRTSIEIADALPSRALWWRLTQEAVVWRQEVQGVPWDIVFAPDTTKVAVAAQEGLVHLYDLSTRQEVSLDANFTRGRKFLALSPSGERLTIAGFDGGHGEWSLTERQWLFRDENIRRIGALTYSPDGTTMYAALLGGKVLRWRTDNHTPLPPLVGRPPMYGQAVHFSSEGIIEGSFRGRILYRNLSDNRPVFTANHGTMIEGVDIHVKTGISASAGRDGIVRLWSKDGQDLGKVAVGSDRPRSMAMSPDGKWIAVGGYIGTLKIIDVHAAKVVRTFKPHSDEVVALKWSPDGRYLATGSRDRQVILLSTPRIVQPQRLRGHDDRVNDVVFSHDGQQLVTGGQDQTVRVWNVNSGTVERVIESGEGAVWRVALSPNDTHLAWASQTVRLTDFRTQTIQHTLQSRGTSPVYGLAFDPTGRWLAATAGSRQVRVYDVNQRRLSWAIETDLKTPRALAFEPHTGQLAVADVAGTLRFWSTETRTAQRDIVVNQRMPNDFAFAPSGQAFASTGNDRILRWWDTPEKAPRHLDQEGPPRTQVAISPDGKMLAVGRTHGVTQLWNPREGTLIREIAGPRDEALGVAFSPDGRWLAVSSVDTTLRVFAVETGRPRWWSSALLAPATLVSHNGWTDLTSNAPRSPTGQWAKTVQDAWRAVEDPSQTFVCIVTFENTLEIWHRAEDRRLRTLPLDAPKDLWAHPLGCTVLTGQGASMYGFEASDDRTFTETNATALSIDGDRTLVATTSTIVSFDHHGSTILHRIDTEVSAIQPIGDDLVLGLRRGSLLYVPAEKLPERFAQPFSFPITRITLGPPGTILVGAADGSVGLWDIHTKKRLHAEQLHGPVVHLVYQGRRAYAATELGDHLEWNLDVFELDWCPLVTRIQQAVPVIWNDGQTVRQVAQPTARCLRD